MSYRKKLINETTNSFLGSFMDWANVPPKKTDEEIIIPSDISDIDE